MKVKKKRIILILSLVAFFACVNYSYAKKSTSELGQFKYRNEIKNLSGIWNKIKLPNTVIGKSEFWLRDLRIYGVSERDSIEIPYFITPEYKSYGVKHTETDSLEILSVKPKISNKISESNTTTVHISFPDKVSINRITFYTDYKYDFKRDAELRYTTHLKYSSGTEIKKLANITLNSDSSNIFYFDDIVTEQLILEIPNQDNQALEISGIQVAAKMHYLVGRFDSGYRYYLYYGNKSNSKPRYDIVNFIENIPDSINTAKLNKREVLIETDIPKQAFEETIDKTILWIVIASLSIGLIFFSIKLLKKD